jgi:hypothetical protein
MARTFMFKTPKDVEMLFNDYFNATPKEEWTITGVCLHCHIHKDTFYEYCKRDDYKDVFNRARLMVENAYELSLRKNGRAGDIFALKNFGWTDKQEVEQVNLNYDMSEDEANEILKRYGKDTDS